MKKFNSFLNEEIKHDSNVSGEYTPDDFVRDLHSLGEQNINIAINSVHPDGFVSELSEKQNLVDKKFKDLLADPKVKKEHIVKALTFPRVFISPETHAKFLNANVGQRRYSSIGFGPFQLHHNFSEMFPELYGHHSLSPDEAIDHYIENERRSIFPSRGPYTTAIKFLHRPGTPRHQKEWIYKFDMPSFDPGDKSELNSILERPDHSYKSMARLSQIVRDSAENNSNEDNIITDEDVLFNVNTFIHRLKKHPISEKIAKDPGVQAMHNEIMDLRRGEMVLTRGPSAISDSPPLTGSSLPFHLQRYRGDHLNKLKKHTPDTEEYKHLGLFLDNIKTLIDDTDPYLGID